MSNSKNNFFRGYDIRGLVDKELNPEVIYNIGKAYATFLYRRQIQNAVIGQDVRKSSIEYKNAFIKALTESGINVIDIGLTLTQIMYFAQYRYLTKGGCIITASHNSVEYNGMKLAAGFSDTLVTKEIDEIKKIYESKKYVTWKQTGKLVRKDVFPEYKADLFKRVPLFDSALKVVIDASNATTAAFLPQILREAGCEVVEQNTNIDPSFPNGTPDPTEEYVLQRLGERVRKEKAQLGLTYDSDGDRVGFVDEDGKLVWNDMLVALFAKDILHYLPGAPIVFNSLCSQATLKTIEDSGGKPVMEKTGHSFIKARVKQERAPFGGELSGHFFFMDNFYGHDDGAFSTLRLLQFLKRSSKTLKQALSELPQYYSSPEIKLGLSDEIKFKFIDESLAPEIKKLFPNAQYSEIDGFRADTKDKMATVRASQNGPYMTVKFEAVSKNEYEKLKQSLAKILDKKGIDWKQGSNTESLK